MFYLPIFFYSFENVKKPQHLNIYIFFCFFFQLKWFTELTENLREESENVSILKTDFWLNSFLGFFNILYKYLKISL